MTAVTTLYVVEIKLVNGESYCEILFLKHPNFPFDNSLFFSKVSTFSRHMNTFVVMLAGKLQ